MELRSRVVAQPDLAPEAMIPTLSLDAYRLADADRLLTPALLVYPDVVRHNVRTTVRLLGGDADRWRPHVKTVKLGAMMRVLVEEGVACVKCATTLELRTACDAGARDVLLAYPPIGARAVRVRQLAEMYPRTRLSALIEHDSQCASWPSAGVGAFVDVNPGMNRTGIADERVDAVVAIAARLADRGIPFRGLHYYDGHISHVPPAEAETVAHAGYRRLLAVGDALAGAGIAVEEVVTAGTPAFPHSLSFDAFASAPFRHRISPGTIVYGDATSAMQLPASLGFRAAAVVLSTVISRPTADRVTCDAGHKTVSADSGVPTCEVLGHPELTPLAPSEEHLPLSVAAGSPVPALGDLLYLLPRHVCPTVNNFDHALLVEGGRARTQEPVTARGREAPLTAARRARHDA